MRNRTRRRLRAAVAGMADELEPGGCYLFGADREAATLGFGELERAIHELLHHAGEAGR
jgi:ribonuclease P protein component